MIKDDKFDLKLKTLTNNSITHIPDNIRKRIDETLISLPVKRPGTKKIRYIVAAVIILFSLTFGIIFTSPRIVEALKQIPVIGFIFEFIGDRGLQNASKKGYAIPVNKSVIDNGINITITEVIFDEARLSVAYLQESESAAGSTIGVELMFDGRSLSGATGQSSRPLDSTRLAGIIDFDTYEELPDKFNLKIKIDKVGNIQGNWEFNIPFSKSKAATEIKEFTPEVRTKYGKTELAIKKITFTSSATEIDFELTEQLTGKSAKSYSFQIFDDQGQKLSFSINGHEMIKNGISKTQYKAVGPYGINFEQPSYFMIHPVISEEIQEVIDLSNLPVTANLGYRENLEVIKIEPLPDKTLLYYRGIDPYNTVFLQDATGKQYIFDHSKPPIIGDNNIFIREYPPLEKNNDLKLLATKSTEPKVINELITKIELQ
ncbi:MAG: hypothetical protein CVU89_00980 [Firmicutes bacterium HGW-Firmicutes-14]|jgi:hypothetical protein|nr:MAG: hypothetical protein CVU89_00980 [Firmicutes bacterium HGW-Firmicutes-14]